MRGVGGELVGDEADLDLILVRRVEVLLGRDVAEHGATIPIDHGGADTAGDVVIAGGDVGGEWAEGVERRFVAPFELLEVRIASMVERIASSESGTPKSGTGMEIRWSDAPDSSSNSGSILSYRSKGSAFVVSSMKVRTPISTKLRSLARATSGFGCPGYSPPKRIPGSMG